MDKFVIAMIALAVILLILMGGGFAVTEYLKKTSGYIPSAAEKMNRLNSKAV